VAHNAQSAQALAANLQGLQHDGRIFIVLSMLTDKDIDAVVGYLAPLVDHWFLAPLDVPRAASLSQMQAALLSKKRVEVSAEVTNETVDVFDDVPAAYQAALAASAKEDLIVVCGSFHTVAAVLDEAV
jgi:dihydrofolate synthase/folylpolyglutamate synthase